MRDEMRPVRRHHMFVRSAAPRLNYWTSGQTGGKCWESWASRDRDKLRQRILLLLLLLDILGDIYRHFLKNILKRNFPAEEWEWKLCDVCFSWCVPALFFKLMDEKVSLKFDLTIILTMWYRNINCRLVIYLLNVLLKLKYSYWIHRNDLFSWALI